MTKAPFFSIVIPALNEEAFLPELLQDLVKQTYQNFEVIIVDGRSVDKTIETARKFISRLAKLTIIKSSQRNVPYQRNLGAKSASGKYLVFFDADVSVPKNYLDKIHQALIKQGVDFLTTWFKGDDTYIKHNLIMAATNILIEASKLIDKPFVCGGSAIISRRAFSDVGGYNEKIKVHEDYDLSVRLNKRGYKLYILKRPMFIVSLRRMRAQGTEKTIRNYAMQTIYFFLRGAPQTDIFKYEMGGQVYK